MYFNSAKHDHLLDAISRGEIIKKKEEKNIHRDLCYTMRYQRALLLLSRGNKRAVIFQEVPNSK